jgi:predicted DNA-binding protein
MAKLPTTDRTETFVFRLSPKTKKKLEELAKKNRNGNNCSAVLRELIEKASRW